MAKMLKFTYYYCGHFVGGHDCFSVRAGKKGTIWGTFQSYCTTQHNPESAIERRVFQSLHSALSETKVHAFNILMYFGVKVKQASVNERLYNVENA